MYESAKLRILLPSSGSLYQGSMQFMTNVGLQVEKESDRKLTGSVKGGPAIEIIFQRSGDIPLSIDNAMGDVGITGLDRYLEHCEYSKRSYVLKENLMFGDSKLVVAVPDGWIDVTTVADLIEISYEFRKKAQNLRLATKYPRLVRRKLEEFGVTNIVLVTASGGLEAAPVVGYADIIADITVTGNTMRENNLRLLDDGILFESQAALVASKNIAKDVKSEFDDFVKAVEFEKN